MEELIACSMNCQNKPIYICDCSDKIFLCLNHIGSHVETAGNHHFTKIIQNPNHDTKNIISKFLKGLKLQINQDRIKIIQESSLLIKQINEITAISLEKLSSIDKKLNEYIFLCANLENASNQNSKSFINSLLKLSAEDASKIKYQGNITKINNENLIEKIDNLFTVQETESLFSIGNFDILKPKIIKYFKDLQLFAVDVLSLSTTSLNLTRNWKGFDPTCSLDDGSIFCCFQSENFIITQHNKIIPLNYTQYNQFSGLIAVDDFIYMFGGNGETALKFSLNSKTWTSIARYPSLNNKFVSCSYINGVILIAGYTYSSVYAYNILNNSYTKISIPLNSNTGKTCLATKNKAYIIEYSKNYYESGLNDINLWTSIGAANMLYYGGPRYSYSLFYEDCFYFITCDYRLIQFNLKNKELKQLITL